MPSLAVVDTNVLVSALLKPAGVPARVADALRRNLLLPVVCTEIMGEYRSVLNRRRLGLPAADVDALLHLIGLQARWVQLSPYPPATSMLRAPLSASATRLRPGRAGAA